MRDNNSISDRSILQTSPNHKSNQVSRWMRHIWTYLQFAEEPLDGVLAHGVDFAPVQRDLAVRLAVLSCRLLQADQALPGLQEDTQDDETSLHVRLRHVHTDTRRACLHVLTLNINTDGDVLQHELRYKRRQLHEPVRRSDASSKHSPDDAVDHWCFHPV